MYMRDACPADSCLSETGSALFSFEATMRLPCSLGMKINAKLGGINVRLAGAQQDAMPHIGRKPVMFLGTLMLSLQLLKTHCDESL